MDSAGRIVLPKAIRETAHVEDGAELEVRIVGDHIRIEPVALEIELKKEGRFVVAVPKKPQEKLTAAEVERTRTLVLQQREESLGGK